MLEECPFEVGDVVMYVPSKEFRERYLALEKVSGMVVGEIATVKKIKDGLLIFEGGKGAMPWSEFRHA